MYCALDGLHVRGLATGLHERDACNIVLTP
jgi:hypothetical protein